MRNGAVERTATRKLVRALLICIVAVGLLIAFVYWTQFRIPAQRLEAELDVIRERGEPVTLEELDDSYERLREEENAAVALMRAIRNLEAYDPDSERSRSLSISWQGASLSELTSTEIQALAEFDAYVEPMLGIAVGTPPLARSRYPIDLELGYSVQLPHLRELRDLARLIAMRAERDALDEEFEGVIENFDLGHSLGRTLSQEPVLISQLVAVAIEGIMLNGLTRICNEAAIDPDHVDSLRETLSDRDVRSAYRTGLIGERAMALRVMRDSYQQTESVHSVGEIVDEYGPLWTFATNFKLVQQWIYLNDGNYYLSKFGSIIESTKGDWRDFRRKSRDLQSAVYLFNPMRPLSSIIEEGIGAASEAFVRLEARYRVADTGLAIELYFFEYGRLPRSLDELVPEFVPELPLDPYTETPLQYFELDGGYAVYSLGPDEEDDSVRWLETRESGKESGDWYFLVERPDLAHR